MEMRLKYEGEALDNHEISCYDLAKALMSVNNIFSEINEVINGKKAKIKVNVKADFQKGSFGVDINIVVSAIETVKNFFNSETVNAVLNAKELYVLLAGGTGIGLITLIKRLKGRSLKEEERDGKITIKDNTIIIINEDGKKEEADAKLIKLYNNYNIRKSAEELVNPIKKDGINKLTLEAEGKKIEIASKKDFNYFKAPKKNETVKMENITQKCMISIIQLSFNKDNSWKFFDGQSNFYAKITDEDFLKAVEEGKINFAKGDILEVSLIKKQFLDNKGNLKIEHYIEKVYDHIKNR